MTFREKIAGAVARLDHYGAPSNDSPLFCEQRSANCLYELLDGIEGEPITLGDLRLWLAEEAPDA